MTLVRFTGGPLEGQWRDITEPYPYHQVCIMPETEDFSLTEGWEMRPYWIRHAAPPPVRPIRQVLYRLEWGPWADYSASPPEERIIHYYKFEE